MLDTIKTIIKRRFWQRNTQNQSALEHFVSGGGERQAAPNLQGIRADHVGRYQLATQFVVPSADILDMACGVGYGAYLLAKETDCKAITAVDINADAIEYGKAHYNSHKIRYFQEDCLNISFPENTFDTIVSFETIEHIKEDFLLMQRFYSFLKPGGKLLLSTPNQTRMPFSPGSFPFHVRHYTPKELEDVVKKSGLYISNIFSQPDNQSSKVIKGWDGLFNIVVCCKPL